MKIRSRSLWLPAVTLVATSCVTGAVLSFNDSARAVISTARPGAWMASSSAGSVSHVGPDGVDATVALPRSQGDLRVVQVDGVAYVTDADGRLSRIDPAQLEVSQETLLPSSNARLVAGGGRLYAVDAAAGTVRELDPVQLTSIGPAVFVGQPLGAAVVDEHGVLWVTDTTTGRVVAVDGHMVGSAHQVAAPGVDVRLSVVGPDIVAVNPSTSTATVVSGPATSEPHAIPREAGATLAGPDAVDEGQILPIVSGPHSLALNQTLIAGEVSTVVHSLNTGVPHAVVFADDLDAADVRGLGRALRFHTHFQPKGTNVNFVAKTGPDSIAIRTYERGVEDETLACGTGMVACALVFGELAGAASPVKVKVRGGDTLEVAWEKTGGSWRNVTLTGPADFTFDGEVALA